MIRAKGIQKQEKRTKAILTVGFVLLLLLLAGNLAKLVNEVRYGRGNPYDISSFENTFSSHDYLDMIRLKEKNVMLGYMPKYDVSEYEAFAEWYVDSLLAEGYGKLGRYEDAGEWSEKAEEHYDGLSHYLLKKRADDMLKAQE